jgi:prevent-host-death family protein
MQYMKNIIPVTDLQRRAANVLSEVNETGEPVVITQRGRASAVLISARRYSEIEEDLALLDDLELLQMLEEAKQAVANGDTISNEEVKRRLNFPS